MCPRILLLFYDLDRNSQRHLLALARAYGESRAVRSATRFTLQGATIRMGARLSLAKKSTEIPVSGNQIDDKIAPNIRFRVLDLISHKPDVRVIRGPMAS